MMGSIPNPSKFYQHIQEEQKKQPLVFDASFLSHQTNIPQQFVWPDEEKPCSIEPKELPVPLIDLQGFLSGDTRATQEASRLVSEACLKHGFFMVVNHGVDAKLVRHAHDLMDDFFEQPLSQKQKAQRKLGEHCGYASSFTNRFSSKLPWKETLSFKYSSNHGDDKGCSTEVVQDYFKSTLGDDFDHLG